VLPALGEHSRGARSSIEKLIAAARAIAKDL
jgi:hypothetical protein